MGLNKGIENDLLIADISTMDGLSMYEDMFEANQKKFWDEYEENVDIPILNCNVSPDEKDGYADCTMSKGNDKDLEEEKVHKFAGKFSPESFPYKIEFKDEEYDMDFDYDFYNSPMIDADVSLRK